MTDNVNSIDTPVFTAWWEVNDRIRDRTNRRISGNPTTSWMDYSLSKHLADKLPLENCLSFGCGSGDVERVFADRNAFVHCDGYEDTGEKEIETAISKARLQNLDNIDYHIVDMNHLVLPPNCYDAAWVNGAFHHIDNLEYVCHQIKQSLKSNGLFILNEYVGPSRFQFSIEQKEIANICLQLLPAELRCIQTRQLEEISQLHLDRGIAWVVHRSIDKLREGEFLNSIQRRYRVSKIQHDDRPFIASEINFPTVSDAIAYDKTLAVRSGEIIPVLKKEFEIVEKRDWGGNVLNFLLGSISHNFLKNDPTAYAYLDMLIAIEDTLLDTNRFDSDFAYIVARPIKD